MVIPAISLHVFFLECVWNFFFLPNIFCPLRFGSADVKTADTKSADTKSANARTVDTKGRFYFSKTFHPRSVLLYVTIRTIPENWSPGDNQTNHGRKKISVSTLGCSVKIWAVAIFFYCVPVLCLSLIFFNSDLNEVQFRV